MIRDKQTIYERIIRAIRAHGRTESERAFCSKIGLSPSYLSSLRDNCDKNPDRSIDVATAARFAQELGITIEALTGHAEPLSDDPYPSRAEAVSAARALQFSQSAIDAAYREDPGTDPGRLWWFRRIEAEDARLHLQPASSSPRLRAERLGSSQRPGKR